MRRIQTCELKLSMIILIIISFIIPANIRENGTLVVYNFGFPCEYWSIYQANKGSFELVSNEYTISRWKSTFENKEYFEKKIGKSIYSLLPNVRENTFKN